MKRQAMTEKMIVVGVDGLDPKHSKFLMDQGKMPNLQKFVELGSAREDLVLLGNMPTVTPPMWTTLATGATARTHGITGFFNQHPTKLDTVIYALDSRLCRAELLWNVLAEAGKKTLVWHWPGSSWPPTSDSINLAVVDGTSPGNIGSGTATIDWHIFCIADEAIDSLKYAAHDATDKGVNGCIITDLENVIGKENDGKMSNADARKAVQGGAKETTFLALNDSETEVNMLNGSNADTINSPIKAAIGWKFAPEGAKEFTLLIANGYTRRPCLILKSQDGRYDRVAVYKNKSECEPLYIIEKDRYFTGYIDEINKNGELKKGSRCGRLMELAEDGSQLKLWLGFAYDLANDIAWHPKSLQQDVIVNFGAPPLIPNVTGKSKENVEKIILPGWELYCQWQGDCLTDFMDKDQYQIIFSHIHNVDGCGHKMWHFAKYRDSWDNDEIFYQNAMDEVYAQTDRYLGRFLPYIDKDWTVIITSDHGLITEENHPPVLAEGVVSVPVMKELGFTVLQTDAEGHEKRGIDWTKTRAVAVRGGQIYINLQGRDPQGIVAPADKYLLEDEIITGLYSYKDPRTGRRVVSVALRNKDAILLGEGGDQCGDITFFMEEGFNIIHMDSLSTQEGYYHTSVSPIFVAAGPGIKQGFVTNRTIRQVDVAPTMAVLAGVRMPADNEGSVVHQILTEEF